MLFMLHVATGGIHEVTNAEDYSELEWIVLPAKPDGPTEQWIWTGSAWAKNIPLGFLLLREKRNALLAASDWTEYSRKLPSQVKAQWLAYRDQLFDLPKTVTDPFNFTWPVTPAEQATLGR